MYAGVNLGHNNDAPAIFAQPNTGTNARFGINCQVGAYVSGTRGPLTGALAPLNVGQGCINDSAP
jgi:hypothetical protein